MRRRTNARIGIHNLFAIGLDVFDNFLNRVGFKIRATDNGHRYFRNQTDIGKRFERFIWKFTVKSGRCRHTDMMKQQRVTIILCLSSPCGTERSACTTNIFNDNLTVQIAAHGLRNKTCHSIGRPTRGEWHNDCDRLAWKGLRKRGCSKSGECQSCENCFFQLNSSGCLLPLMPSKGSRCGRAE